MRKIVNKLLFLLRGFLKLFDLIFYLFCQKYIIEGVVAGAVKG